MLISNHADAVAAYDTIHISDTIPIPDADAAYDTITVTDAFRAPMPVTYATNATDCNHIPVMIGVHIPIPILFGVPSPSPMPLSLSSPF